MPDEPIEPIVKLCGIDAEVGNFLTGPGVPAGTSREASRALLREFEGIPPSDREDAPRGGALPRHGFARGRAFPPVAGSGPVRIFRGSYDNESPRNPQDWGRKYLPSNGGCVYIDLNHLELCIPEVRSAFDHLAYWHGMLRIARSALNLANAQMPPEYAIRVLVNNSDGRGSAYGSHLSFLLHRRAYENIFSRRVHYLLYLASFQVSSVIYTGQGKVGSERGGDPVRFQLSQRADFFVRTVSEETTSNRGIVNSRNEPLCGDRFAPGWNGHHPARTLARLHVIFFDNTLSHIPCLLKVGTMQILLAMIEAGEVDCELLLEDPVAALERYSRDPELRARARTVSGRSLTAIELQRLFHERAKRFVDAGRCDGIVPRADEIVSIWGETLDDLERGDIERLSRRLDWALKLTFLERAMARHPELDWTSPGLKHVDHLYSSLALEEGLFWTAERSGFTHRLVGDETIAACVSEPPRDTRAFTRAMLLRSVDPAAIEEVAWDFIRFRSVDSGRWVSRRTFEMDDPLAFGAEKAAPVLTQEGSLSEMLDALDAIREERSPS